MKKTLVTIALFSTMMYGLDLAAIASSVDSDKAMGSVDSQKAMAAAAKGKNVSMKDISDSVDTDKAVDSVDKQKLMKSLGVCRIN